MSCYLSDSDIQDERFGLEGQVYIVIFLVNMLQKFGASI